MKRGRSHRWSARLDDAGQQAPSKELNDGAAHQRMSRQGVGPVVAAIDEQHAPARTGEEHGRCRARAARADHDRVEVARDGLVLHVHIILLRPCSQG
jgi:hypothetical protein